MNSANMPNGDLVTFSIKINGSALKDTASITSVVIHKELNTISKAVISIMDGDAANGTFEQSSSSNFTPGNKVTIKAGYDSDDRIVFEGIITNQNLKVHQGAGAILEVICQDMAVKMSVGKKTQVFSNIKDSKLINSLINNYSGLSSAIQSTDNKSNKQVQYNMTDWDYMISRAYANGMLVTTLNNKVSVFKPDSDTKSVYTINYGVNLLSFYGDINAVSQFGKVNARSWNYDLQNIANVTSLNDTSGPGNLSSKKLSEVVGLSEYQLQTTAPIESSELSNWAKSEMTWSEFSKICGELEIIGTHIIDPGKYITLHGLGDRFNGDHFVSGVTHTLSEGNWISKITIGISSEQLGNSYMLGSHSNAESLSRVQGLYNGKVKKMYQDPENQYRILVEIPLFGNSDEALWARLSSFYATSGAGAFFLPEIGDEVIVGFLDEDPRFPVILGSVYSSEKNKPYESLNPLENNPRKAIVSKSGIHMEFDDEKKQVSIMTPSKNQIILSDEDKSISIKDQNSNSIVMSEEGILIKSSKNIAFESDQIISLKGVMGVKSETENCNIMVEAESIKMNAENQFRVDSIDLSLIGEGQAYLASSAETRIQGGKVMIN